MDDSLLALAAAGVTDHPAHRVTGRDRNELLTCLQRNVGDLVDGGVELIERTLGVGIDLDGIDVAVLDGLDSGRGVGADNPVPRRLVVSSPLQLLRDRL